MQKIEIFTCKQVDQDQTYLSRLYW